MRGTKFSAISWPDDQTICSETKKKKKKKTYLIVDFAVPANHKVKLKESEKRYRYQDPARDLRNMKHKVLGGTCYNWCARYSHKRICKETERLGNKKKVETIQTLLRSAKILSIVQET